MRGKEKPHKVLHDCHLVPSPHLLDGLKRFPRFKQAEVMPGLRETTSLHILQGSLPHGTGKQSSANSSVMRPFGLRRHHHTRTKKYFLGMSYIYSCVTYARV